MRLIPEEKYQILIGKEKDNEKQLVLEPIIASEKNTEVKTPAPDPKDHKKPVIPESNTASEKSTETKLPTPDPEQERGSPIFKFQNTFDDPSIQKETLPPPPGIRIKRKKKTQVGGKKKSITSSNHQKKNKKNNWLKFF